MLFGMQGWISRHYPTDGHCCETVKCCISALENTQRNQAGEEQNM